MLKAGVAKRSFKPGKKLKAEIVMLRVLEKAGPERQLAVGCHARARHIDHARAAEIVANQVRSGRS
jgi:hypothetical protein